MASFYDEANPLVGDVLSPNAAHRKTKAHKSRASGPGQIEFNMASREVTATSLDRTVKLRTTTYPGRLRRPNAR